jgi:hypothetical protein
MSKRVSADARFNCCGDPELRPGKKRYMIHPNNIETATDKIQQNAGNNNRIG